jgi:predicted benzoate:H+ symporter BenE
VVGASVNRISPLFGWLVCLATTVVVFLAGNLLGGCSEHETASKVWSILMLVLMVATLALSVWGMVGCALRHPPLVDADRPRGL